MGLTYGGHKLVENTTKKVCSKKNLVILSKQDSDILFLGMIIPHLIDDPRERNKKIIKENTFFCNITRELLIFWIKVQ